jgi:molecular chaperone DnaJ
VIDGDAEISIKEGTQPGSVLRLRGRGVPKLMSGDASQRGDHYFTVKVEIPTQLSEAERALVEELKKERQGAGGQGQGQSQGGEEAASGGGKGGSGSFFSGIGL